MKYLFRQIQTLFLFVSMLLHNGAPPVHQKCEFEGCLGLAHSTRMKKWLGQSQSDELTLTGMTKMAM